jgi:hypothetical protein
MKASRELLAFECFDPYGQAIGLISTPEAGGHVLTIQNMARPGEWVSQWAITPGMPEDAVDKLLTVAYDSFEGLCRNMWKAFLAPEVKS